MTDATIPSTERQLEMERANRTAIEKVLRGLFEEAGAQALVEESLAALAEVAWLDGATIGVALSERPNDPAEPNRSPVIWSAADGPTLGCAEVTARALEIGSQTWGAADGAAPGEPPFLATPIGADLGALLVRPRDDAAAKQLDPAMLQLAADLIGRGLELRHREGELLKTKSLLETTMNTMVQGIAVYDETLRLQTWSKRFEEIMELPTGWVRPGLTMRDYFHMNALRGEYGDVDPDIAVEERTRQLRVNLNSLEPHRYVRQRPNGSFVEITGQPMPCGGMVTTFVDVTTEHRAKKEAERLAWTDPLSGLNNRNSFRATIETFVSAADFENRGFALLMIDLDRFKPINDTYGHDVGDRVLQIIAERLRDTVREGDVCFRLGGDEFAILMKGLDDVEAIVSPTKRLLTGLTAPMDVDGRQLNVGASIGISFYPNDDRMVDELMRKADLALYEAKAGGRGDYKIYDTKVDEKARRARRIEDDLQAAIEDDALELYFQPIVDAQSRALIGAEALLRWPHPERGMQTPGEFIPIAEQCGLISRLGAWVTREVWRTLDAWSPLLRDTAFTLSMNVSPRQFFDVALVEMLRGYRAENARQIQHLSIEITEDSMQKRSDEAIAILRAIRELGVDIAIDDFGTGYSSFSYLYRMPCQVLKIDRSFVGDLCQSSSVRPIVDSIIGLAHKLDMSVVAEGVETAEQVHVLREMGCDRFQGYYLGRPAPRAMFEQRLIAELDPDRRLAVGS